jgi:hypothetical protein
LLKVFKNIANNIFKIFGNGYVHPCWKHPALRKIWAEPCKGLNDGRH